MSKHIEAPAVGAHTHEPCQCMCLDGCTMLKPKISDRAHPYVGSLVGCGHGVLFTEYCRDCEIVSLQDQYRAAIRTVQAVRDRMRVLGQQMPGHTS